MANPLPSLLDNLNGSNGVRAFGLAAGDNTGQSVSAAGDVNGDGFDDFLIGAPSASGDVAGAGATYVVFGTASGWDPASLLSSLDGTQGFRLLGLESGDAAGKSVRGAGDLNGDGYADLVVGAQNFGAGQPAGAAFVVWGSATPFAASLSLDSLGAGTGLRIVGASDNDAAGYSVADAGDVNGDGFDDLLIGARSADPGANNGAGAAYVVFGSADPGPGPLTVSSLNGSNGFKLSGSAAGAYAGMAVRAAGDVNGDGFDDIIIGAPYASGPGLTQSGAAYVVFGSAGAFAANIDLASLNGTNGVQLLGADNDKAGMSVSGAGDVNGDGWADVIVGAPCNGQGPGIAYVVFGRGTGFASSLNLGALDGTAGFRLTGAAAGDAAGRSVSRAGDVNGDGLDDLIVGAHLNDSAGTSSGAVTIVYGRSTAFEASLALASLSGSTGFQLTGSASGDFAGRAVADAGDVNGDGFADLMVGATGADGPAGNTGAAYLVLGGDFTGAAGTMGGATADQVAAATGDAVVYAGAGDDRISLSSSSIRRLDGGGGTDTLALTGAGTQLDLTQTANSRITGIEIIDLAATGSQSLRLAAGDLFDLSRSSNTLRVLGDGRDAVQLAGTWAATGRVDIDAQSFASYQQGAATLLIETDVAIATRERALSALDGSNGFRLVGAAEHDGAGRAVRGAGDINGDGFDDVIVGAYGADGPNLDRPESGVSYVVFGQSDGFAATVDLALLDGNNGFKLAGVGDLHLSGFAVAGAGDVNGDGLDDLLIGAYGAGASGSQAGAAYVVFGRAGGFDSTLDLALLDGQNGFALTGAAAFDFAGRDLDSAGDVNGDGFDDIVIGAHGADPQGSFSGATYVVFGKAQGFAPSLSLGTLDGSNGFLLSGVATNSASGAAVAGAGDVNGDGFADLIVGAYRAGAADTRVGASYVVFGKAGGFSANLPLSALNGSNGFQIGGGASQDYAGRSVSGAGDVNGDGFDDLLIGAYGADPNGALSGVSYVVFGKAGGFGSIFDVAALDGSNGFRVLGAAAGDRSGLSVSRAGDVNGDGLDDIVIGAYKSGTGGAESGAAYVVFGRSTGFAATLDLAALPAEQGFQWVGESAGDLAGRSVGAAGDVNGDGYSDLVIGAYGADPNGLAMAGASYVVFGSNFNGAVSHPGSAQADSLLGGAGADRLLAMQGNDTLAGRGGADVLHGGTGVDVADYTASALAVQVDLSSGLGLGGDAQGDQLSAIENLWGSAGNDMLSGDALANALDGGAGNDTLIGRAGADNLSGGAGFDRLEGGDGDDTLRGAENADTLLGGDGNDLLGGGKGVDSLDGGAGDDTLSGAAGADILIGGDGLDLVDYSAATDAVVVNLTIVGVPQLISVLQSSDSLSGIERVRGSNLSDTLTGDAANNQLFGLPGHDTLVGNEGFDTLEGGDGDDLLVGGANADLLLGGAGNDTLGGGKGVDTMDGGDGDDWLTGALGSDLLTGGAGADRFVFNATVNGTNNIDTVSDFESGFDLIHLAASIFTALAPQAGQQLGIGDHLLYDNATGRLSYDADGAGPGAPMAFAVLGVGSHPDTLGNDFLIVN